MKAAVLEEIGKPLQIIDTELDLPTIRNGQVLVKMLTSGICGAQLQEINGQKGDPSHCPHLLGHEGCGMVGTDKVVVHWAKGEGADPEPPKLLGYIKAGPCTTFSEYTVVSRNRVTSIPSDVPSDLAALFGCCLSTALATVENVARIKQDETVLIIGAGGVGLAMILAAKIAGAQVIDCTDIQRKEMLAMGIGATRFVPSYLEDYYYHGQSYDVIIDTCGALSRASLLAPGGRYILVGQPMPEMTLQPFTAGWIFRGNGCRIEATNGGGFNPTKDIPRYIQMWRDGKLDGWGKIITHRISLDKINDGIQLMRDGRAGRVMIEFPE